MLKFCVQVTWMNWEFVYKCLRFSFELNSFLVSMHLNNFGHRIRQQVGCLSPTILEDRVLTIR